RPTAHGGGGAGRARLRPARRHEGPRRRGVLLQLLLAAEDRVLLPVGHPPAALPDRPLQLPGIARRVPPPRLLPRQAVLLLVDLRLRRPRPHRRRLLPPPLRQVAGGLALREGVHLPGAGGGGDYDGGRRPQLGGGEAASRLRVLRLRCAEVVRPGGGRLLLGGARRGPL